ncbi:MAG: PAS domain-containing protein [Alphaproteobacteria bacterium]|nr:PAS domain-containing protein [Alphaproteobacteria bacterium]MDE2110017.1 PAS domain-containing protein [Alphaproteobacteria bacterium]
MSTLTVDGTIFEIAGLGDVDDPLLRQGIAYWESLRGARAFPAREQLQPRAIAPLLSRTVLIDIIDGGADFEYVIVGDEVARAYSARLIHRRISDIAYEMPNTIAFWDGIYREMCREPKLRVVRMRAGHDGETHFLDGMVVLLPLGASDSAIDHIVTFGRRSFIGI